MKDLYRKKQVTLFIFFLALLLLGVLSLNIGLNNEKKVSLKYSEDNNIDYKVYLKDNDFFDTKYIEKGKTYITSLIDYIHIDFKYKISFDNLVKVDYRYKVVARVEANKADNESGNYWNKEYDITSLKKQELSNVSDYSINESIDVDYNKYNEILNSFKEKVGIGNLDGILKIYLKVESDARSDDIATPIESNLILKLPLSQLAIEAAIDSSADNNIKTITETRKNDALIFRILNISAIVFIALSVIVLLLIFRNRRIYASNNKYELAVRKILNTYDSIIVNVEEEPDVKGYNLIRVKSFEELLDAHSEIRLPINCFQGRKYTVFVLLNDNTAWKYILENKGVRKDER